MALTVRQELAAAAVATIGDLNPILPGERIRVWACGEAADATLTVNVGTKGVYRGRLGIESTANSGPKFDENLIADWTQPPQMGEADLQITNGAVISQIMVMKT